MLIEFSHPHPDYNYSILYRLNKQIDYTLLGAFVYKEGLKVNSYLIEGLLKGVYYFVIVAYNQTGQTLTNNKKVISSEASNGTPNNPDDNIIIIIAIMTGFMIAIGLGIYIYAKKPNLSRFQKRVDVLKSEILGSFV